jgi:O-antigen/teichoic acid export membrane protein
MSMAWANLINIIVTILAYSYIRPASQPILPSLKGWRSIAHFGGGTALSNLMTNINIALPDTLIGKRLDAHRVGLFGRANSLVDLFSQIVMPAINNNVIPVIARNHHAKQSLSTDLCRSVSYLSCIAWPVVIVTSLFSRDMILVLYGEKWIDSISVIVWLCIAAAARTPFALTTNACIAIGRPYLSMLTVGSTIFLKLLISLVVGANSLTEFAIAFMIAEILSLPINLSLWKLQFKISLSEVWHAIWPSLYVTLIYSAIIIPVNLYTNDWSMIARLAMAAILSLFTWIAIVMWTHHPIADEIQLSLQGIKNKFK